jgi:hypothetical protein
MFYYKNKYECDFVTVEMTKPKLAIQVCWKLDEKNRKRELAGLKNAMDEFEIPEGLILTNEEAEENSVDVNGKKAEIVPVWRWLLKAPD